MKEKIKPIAIYGGAGTALGAATAYLMKKRDSKNMLVFAGVGLLLGAAVGYFMAKKDEDKSGVAGLKKGDKVTIGGKEYVVTAYGSLK